MKIKHLLLIAAVIALGCNRAKSVSESPNEGSVVIPSVTFTSHLWGDIASDPTIAPGQTIRVVPDQEEPTQNHESIIVQLPQRTPYSGDDQQYYLRGFAIGNLSAHNIHFW